MSFQESNGELRNRKDNILPQDSSLIERDDTEKNNLKSSSSNTRIIGLVFLSLLLDLLAFTMILPLLPSLLDYYNKEEGQGNTIYASLLRGVQGFQRLTGAPDRFASVLFGGALGSLYSFLQFLTSPIVGSLSDAYGRKPMLLICLSGIALSHALWSYASTFSLFVLARFIGGLSKANVSLSMAVVTDASTEKTRPRGMALIGLAFSIGFIVGPLAGAWFSKNSDGTSGSWGERPAYYALSLALANIALVLFFIPETLSKDKRAPLSFTLSKTVDYVSPWHLLRFTAVKNLTSHQNQVLNKLGLIYFLYLFLYSGLEFTITFLTHHTFKYTAMQQGKMFLVIGVIMAVLQGGAARRLGAARLPRRGAGRPRRPAGLRACHLAVDRTGAVCYIDGVRGVVHDVDGGGSGARGGARRGAGQPALAGSARPRHGASARCLSLLELRRGSHLHYWIRNPDHSSCDDI